jgi:hypothetical protein
MDEVKLEEVARALKNFDPDEEEWIRTKCLLAIAQDLRALREYADIVYERVKDAES